ncbi:MAG: hypothetical protein J6O40_00615 [Ruminococcus sp.]|nr:hypothetical protein [Ruminococcus sp.]
MKNKPLILAIKGDARQEYAIAALKERFEIKEVSFPLDGAGAADILLLPMLAKNGSFEGIERHLKSGALILGGRIPTALRERFEAQGYEVTDYYDSEALRIKNALPTAEGALMIALENTPFVLSGKSVLITGFGACAKQTARLFAALGANVLIAARNPVQLADAQSLGYKTAALCTVGSVVGSADIIINTVPAHIFGREEIAASKKSALFIEIASYPYGIDEQAAHSLSRGYINAPGLPGKCAPKTSGEYIAAEITDIILKRKEGER